MNEKFMMRAVSIAMKGIGFTSPNPCVGAVIEKGGRIVAEGWHKKAGGPHGEVLAVYDLMKKSGIKSVERAHGASAQRGEQSGFASCEAKRAYLIDSLLFSNATLYVTLEPCCHCGKTPPCTDLIIKSGFKKVCIGMKDPFAKVNGKGIEILKKAGIKIELCKKNSKLGKLISGINQPFIKWVSTGIPYVTMKAGMSLDGKIATSKKESKWITSELSIVDGKIERSKCDAVIVGSGTVKADNPRLKAYGKYSNKYILKVILNKKLDLNLRYKIFKDKNVFVACTDLASNKNKNQYRETGIKFKSFGKKEISIESLLKYLGKSSVQSVFVEGGGITNGYFFSSFLKNKKLLDKVIFYVAPKLMGGQNSLSVIGGNGIDKLKNVVEFKSFESQKIGSDFRVTGIINFY